MRTIKKGLLLLLFVSNANSFSMTQVTTSNADKIIGTWMMPDDEGIIKIFKDGKYYNGKIIWLKEREKDGSPLKDIENPVDSLRNRDVEGLEVMRGFQYEGDNTWSGGTFYAAKKGKEVEPDFILEDKDHLNIKISIFIFSLIVELTRVDTIHFFQKLNRVK
ncbi:hypothetical protein MNBD_IGNAVI01-696 [hydrothermal vent metagenome]|uniref:DUF2147 domain-containing protein n=1 Tax=hydrothermal vent metagenome TaxID=652676 RepID=A0A3B1BX37_9ZZZZ